MDLSLTWSGAGADLALDGSSLAAGDTLRAAVIASLFSDRLAEADDSLPGAPDDRRGWWADAWAEAAGDRMGSRLWLLARAKRTQGTLDAAVAYAQEALAWLVADGVAARVEVAAEWLAEPVGLALAVTITRPTGGPLQYRFSTAFDEAANVS